MTAQIQHRDTLYSAQRPTQAKACATKKLNPRCHSLFAGPRSRAEPSAHRVLQQQLATELLPAAGGAGLLALMLHAEGRRRAKCARRVSAACRAGSCASGAADDRGGRAAALARQRLIVRRPLQLEGSFARRTFVAFTKVTLTEKRWCSYTTRCWRSSAHR